MFRPLSLFIGLRYTRAKKRNHFISFISMTSMFGIALGVAVLITVLSVMNGFDYEIKNRIFEMAPQIVIKSVSGNINDWQNLLEQVKKFPKVQEAAPFVSGQGMLARDGIVYPVVVNGVDVKEESKISELSTRMTAGSLSALKPKHFGMVVGKALADNLGLEVGDKITLITPQATLSPIGILPSYKRFQIVGIFEAGSGFGFDSQLAFINLQDAQALFRMPNMISGIRIKTPDFFAAPQLSAEYAQQLPAQYYVTNWTETYGALFSAIKLEKTMMFFILLLIITVAAFNLVSTLVMVVNDKQADIAILRTFGATPKTIRNIFMVQGGVIGGIGTLLGLIGGIILAKNVTQVANVLQNLLHVQLLSSSVYYVNYLPSRLQWSDVWQICIVAFLLSLLATIYPAWRASRVQPAEALRYE